MWTGPREGGTTRRSGRTKLLLERLSSPMARSESEDQVRVPMLISDFMPREAESDADSVRGRIPKALRLPAAPALVNVTGQESAYPAPESFQSKIYNSLATTSVRCVATCVCGFAKASISKSARPSRMWDGDLAPVLSRFRERG